MGRPLKLTLKKQEEMVKYIKIGLYFNTVCESANVDYTTFRRWLKMGEEEESGKYRTFYDAVKKAEADAELRMVMNWQQHVKDDWKAAQAFLERRYPERWARKEKVEIMGKDGGAIEIADARNLLIEKLGILQSGDKDEVDNE